MDNEVVRVLKGHKSIRNFDSRKVEKEVITEILEAGIRAANAGNLQGYSLIVIDDIDKLQALGIYNTPIVIIALADAYRTERWFSVFGEKNVPVNTTHGFFMNNWDAIICLHNIVIAAESLGLGAYYNGDVTSMNLKKVINNPSNTFPSAMICLGYPKSDGKTLDRLPLEAVVHYNSYKVPTDEEIKEWYSEKEHLFQTRNSKERLEKLNEIGISNIAQSYARNKFKQEELEAVSESLKNNIKESGYKIF